MTCVGCLHSPRECSHPCDRASRDAPAPGHAPTALRDCTSPAANLVRPLPTTLSRIHRGLADAFWLPGASQVVSPRPPDVSSGRLRRGIALGCGLPSSLGISSTQIGRRSRPASSPSLRCVRLLARGRSRDELLHRPSRTISRLSGTELCYPGVSEFRLVRLFAALWPSPLKSGGGRHCGILRLRRTLVSATLASLQTTRSDLVALPDALDSPSCRAVSSSHLSASAVFRAGSLLGWSTTVSPGRVSYMMRQATPGAPTGHSECNSSSRLRLTWVAVSSGQPAR